MSVSTAHLLHDFVIDFRPSLRRDDALAFLHISTVLPPPRRGL